MTLFFSLLRLFFSLLLSLLAMVGMLVLALCGQSPRRKAR